MNAAITPSGSNSLTSIASELHRLSTKAWQLKTCTSIIKKAFIVALVTTATLTGGQTHAQESALPALSESVVKRFGERPAVPTSADLPDDIKEAMQAAFVEPFTAGWGEDQKLAMQKIADSKDPRLAWLISDLMRFTGSRTAMLSLSEASSQLLGIEYESNNIWGKTTDHLIAWKIPAPPGYLPIKRTIFTSVEPEWVKIFTEGDIDWTQVSWGGVLIDNRPYDQTDELCNCIPAADNPEVSSAEDATWLDDDDIVFGVEINGEYRAYPRQIMEVREMVNDTLGGRNIGMPYCTLCGAAQAYFTDEIPEGTDRPVLRTSGLLSRSNKVMYDINSWSVFDTFTGAAVTGPLAELGVKLNQASVVTSEWGEWKRAHPETTVLVESLALGRDFDFRNNRDANGPIFPIGDVDPRLPVHEDVIGVVTESGKPYAFQRSKAVIALQRGENVGVENIKLILDAGGIRVVDKEGADLGSHQAFWFAWSQFHPSTNLWPEL